MAPKERERSDELGRSIVVSNAHKTCICTVRRESKFPNTSAILYIEEATPHYYLPQILKKTALF